MDSNQYNHINNLPNTNCSEAASCYHTIEQVVDGETYTVAIDANGQHPGSLPPLIFDSEGTRIGQWDRDAKQFVPRTDEDGLYVVNASDTREITDFFKDNQNTFVQTTGNYIRSREFGFEILYNSNSRNTDHSTSENPRIEVGITTGSTVNVAFANTTGEIVTYTGEVTDKLSSLDKETDDPLTLEANKNLSPEEILDGERLIDNNALLIRIHGDRNNDGKPDPLPQHQIDAYVQLIQDGPEGEEWDRYIAALKSAYGDNYPEIQNAERLTDAQINQMSLEEQVSIRQRRERFAIGDGDQNSRKQLGEWSLTQRLEVILADPCKNTFFSNIESTLNKFFKKISGFAQGANKLAGEIKSVARLVRDMSSGFIGQMGGFLRDKLIGWVKKGLQAVKMFFFATSTNPLSALAKTKAFHGGALAPVGLLMNAVTCLVAKVMDAIGNTIEDMIVNMVKNVIQSAVCAVQDFVGGLVNKIINVMDAVIGPFINPINSLFSIIGLGFGNVKSILGKGLSIINKLGNLFKCGGDKKRCPPSSVYVIDQGTVRDKGDEESQGLLTEAMNKASQKMANIKSGINDFSDGVGDWELFGSKVGDSEPEVCNTGNVFECGTPKVEFIGGNGQGAFGKVLLGNVMNKFDTDNLGAEIKSTASIIGVEMTYPGEGYTEAPIVAFTDRCDQGYGAYGRAVMDEDPNSPTFGQIVNVVILSEGVNYPMGDVEDVYVDKVLIDDGGEGYSDGESIGDFTICGVDHNGSITKVCVNDKAYHSLPPLDTNSMGIGARLHPIMTTKRRKTELQTQIDCVTT